MPRYAVWTLVVVVGTIAAWTATTARQLPPILAVHCLHDENATAMNRQRRAGALALARAINEAQGQALERTQQFLPIDALTGLPAAPDGFALRFYTDGDGYIFSLKDTRDACHYGIFSDEHGRLYEMSPQVPQLAG